MKMNARRKTQTSKWNMRGSRGTTTMFMDAVSDEQLYERIGQARMRIEDEGLILEACRQTLRQRGLSYE